MQVAAIGENHESCLCKCGHLISYQLKALIFFLMRHHPKQQITTSSKYLLPAGFEKWCFTKKTMLLLKFSLVSELKSSHGMVFMLPCCLAVTTGQPKFQNHTLNHRVITIKQLLYCQTILGKIR
jgi:hypothetical protein